MSSNILLIICAFISNLLYPALFDNYRLNDTVIPKHYELKILTSIEDEITYTGQLEIITQCLNTTNKITLHRDRSIKLEKIELKEIDTPQNYKTINEVPLDKIIYSNKMDFLMISTREDLKENQYYLIQLEFKGNLSETPAGIFRGNFSSSSGTSYYAITIFEPMGARRAFPCFDEPGMTATFELTIGRKEKYNSSANMPLLKSEPVEGKDGWYWDHFMNSFPMSTYLVCFMIYDGEFYWTGKEEDQIKILARKTIKSSMNMVTQVSPKLLAYLQKYFQIPFPFPKLEFIAVPHVLGNKDSISTPGLVVMHEKLLFYESFVMKQDDVQEILYDVAQKMSFQWISLVAVQWWSDVCVIRSLTSYNTRYALDSMSGSQSIERDVPDSLLQFFREAGGFPLAQEIFGDLVSVTQALNSIDYEKCGLLIRMAQFLSGNIALKDITAQFLKKNSFQTVNQEDFWKVFESFTPKNTFLKEAPLHFVMKNWLSQSHLPVIEVIRNYESKTATLIQKVPNTSVDEKKGCWWIPITYTIEKESKNLNMNIRDWSKCPNEIVEIESLPSSDWLLVNLQVTSLYRVKYDPENLRLLHSTLRQPVFYGNIPPLNRMQLVDDLFEFTLKEELNITLEFLLEFMEFVKFDLNYATWTSFARNMFTLHWRLQSNEEAVNLLDSYMQNVVGRHFVDRKFDKKEKNLLNMSLSALITEVSCFFKLPGCLKEVHNIFKKFRSTKYPLHVESLFSTDLRDIIFCYAIKHGGRDDFNFLLSVFTKSTNIFEREDILRGLYCTQDTSLFKKIPISRRVPRGIGQSGHLRNNIVKSISKRPLTTEREDNPAEVPEADEQVLDTYPLVNSITSAAFTNSMRLRRSPTLTNDSEVSMDTTIKTTTFINDADEAINETTYSSDYTGNLTSFTTPSGLVSTSNIPGPTENSVPPNKLQESEDVGQSKIDSNGPDLEFIILRSKMDIVTDIFYKKIISMALPKALHYIWLYSERISRQKELDNFERFFKNHEEIFRDIEPQIKDQIQHVKQNLKWQEEKTKELIKALRKYSIFEDKKRSDTSRNLMSNSLKLFFILRTLIFFRL